MRFVTDSWPAVLMISSAASVTAATGFVSSTVSTAIKTVSASSNRSVFLSIVSGCFIAGSLTWYSI